MSCVARQPSESGTHEWNGVGLEAGLIAKQGSVDWIVRLCGWKLTIKVLIVLSGRCLAVT